MLEPPTLPHETIIACLRDTYDLSIDQLAFLPIGADANTAVYRAVADDSTAYFVKLRSGAFDAMTITVPKLLHDQGVEWVIAPRSTRTQELWTDLDPFKLAVFPFIEGRNAYEMTLSDSHWVEFGHALKAIHTANVPKNMIDHIRRETYPDHWRVRVRNFLRMAAEAAFSDRTAIELVTFLHAKRKVITTLVQRAEDLAAVLQANPHPFILCHADIHAGNLLIDANDRLYIVDWDTLTYAPKERDLMYIGGGLFANHRPPEEEIRLFYQGYGAAEIDPVVIAYYRYERIVQDIAEYCQQILLSDDNPQDRANGLRTLMSQFEPDQVVEVAFRAEQFLPRESQAN